MNWEAIGAIGEVAGAIGVIVTLIYLAAQIRQSSRAIESQNIHAQTQQMQQQMFLQANPEMAKAIEKAYVTGVTLDVTELILLEAYLISRIAAIRDDFLHFKQGFIDRVEWEQRKRRFQPYFIAEQAKAYWRNSNAYYEPDFRDEITQLVDEPLEHNYIKEAFARPETRPGSN